MSRLSYAALLCGALLFAAPAEARRHKHHGGGVGESSTIETAIPPADDPKIAQAPEGVDSKINAPADDANREPAAMKKRKSVPAAAAVKGSGADSEEGYIIKRTKDGVVKIPRKQTFKFEGAQVDGAVNRPSQTALGTRSTPTRATLIPERKSFRGEALDTEGIPRR